VGEEDLVRAGIEHQHASITVCLQVFIGNSSVGNSTAFGTTCRLTVRIGICLVAASIMLQQGLLARLAGWQCQRRGGARWPTQSCGNELQDHH
jgi:hypothetical protein